MPARATHARPPGSPARRRTRSPMGGTPPEIPVSPPDTRRAAPKRHPASPAAVRCRIQQPIAPSARRAPLPRHTLPHAPVVIVVRLHVIEVLARRVHAQCPRRVGLESRHRVPGREVTGLDRRPREIRSRHWIDDEIGPHSARPPAPSSSCRRRDRIPIRPQQCDVRCADREVGTRRRIRDAPNGLRYRRRELLCSRAGPPPAGASCVVISTRPPHWPSGTSPASMNVMNAHRRRSGETTLK